jgi:RNA polymerase sigma-70 factor, ECF subfamily
LPDRTTDDVLLERALVGDPAAFLQVYQRHRDAVYRFAYRLSGTVETAEDITHDCFLSLMSRPGEFNPELASLRTYLFSAARNLWLKQLRKSGREFALDEVSEDRLEPLATEPIDDLLESELVARVRDAVLSLPPLQQEALVLYEYEELSLSEIAVAVGAEIGTVKARLHRARERLRRSLYGYLNSSREVVTLEKA